MSKYNLSYKLAFICLIVSVIAVPVSAEITITGKDSIKLGEEFLLCGLTSSDLVGLTICGKNLPSGGIALNSKLFRDREDITESMSFVDGNVFPGVWACKGKLDFIEQGIYTINAYEFGVVTDNIYDNTAHVATNIVRVYK